MTTLDFSQQELQALKAIDTATEINHQPVAWQQTLQIIEQKQEELLSFLKPILDLDNAQVILTGAGTSAFVGRTIKPFLAKFTKVQIHEIATTDLVSNAYQYFEQDRPTLLISFARSGNSPESNGAVDIAEQCLSKVFHLVVTCNPEGKLALAAENKSNALVLLMPELTNDRSFAMTSSYTSMMLATLAIFTLVAQQPLNYFYEIAATTKNLIAPFNQQAKSLVNKSVERLVYLGSGGLQGLAQEGALKVLELTSGLIMATYDSPLGFRHGPKSLINSHTAIIEFVSNNPYTQKYDLDLLKEVSHNNIATQVIAIATKEVLQSIEKPNYTQVAQVVISDFADYEDQHLIFPYIVFAQIYAFHASLLHGRTPDNPCPTGEVNRVVQGVTIYPYHK